MKKLLFIIFTTFYLMVQLSFSLCCFSDYVKKEVADHLYDAHLKNLPSRFNILDELNKVKEHQQQQNNLPDFNHLVVFSEYYRPQNNFTVIINSINIDYSFIPVSKISLGFSKCFLPPPEVL